MGRKCQWNNSTSNLVPCHMVVNGGGQTDNIPFNLESCLYFGQKLCYYVNKDSIEGLHK